MHRLVRTVLVAGLVAAFSAGASAATAPADAIKYRKAVMDAMAAHVSAFVLINFGKVDQQEYLKSHANALADLGAQGKVLFPAGTDTGDTNALPLTVRVALPRSPTKKAAALALKAPPLRFMVDVTPFPFDR